MGRVRLENAEATLAFGQKMALELPRRAILALSGDLGAGKTTFVQGLALGLGIQGPVQSPTFVLFNNYEDKLFHFDLYRLKGAADFTHLGFSEYFHQPALCAIEWAERITPLLPPETIYIHFHYDNTGRLAEVRS